MNLLLGALRKPITVLVAVLAIIFFSVMAIRNMKIDIFPTLGLPTRATIGLGIFDFRFLIDDFHLLFTVY